MPVMERKLDFYFDFMSPFAYLAHKRLPAIADRYDYAMEYKPIELAKAKQAAGNTGPSNREIPVKLRYLTTDMKRWAARYGVPLQFPKSLDSARLNKGTFYAVDRHQAQDYVECAWLAAWGRGGDMGNVDFLSGVAAEMGWSAAEFLDFTLSPTSAKRYESSNREAQQRGVFGVPTAMIGEEMWWGNDRLDFLGEYLESACAKA